LQPLLSDLGGTITKNKISDFPVIPTTLSQLSGQVPVSTISNFPAIPTALSQLSGQIPVSTISNFPSIPDSYTKGLINKVITSYGNSLIFTGSSFIAINRFRYSMNGFGNFDDGFNARFYVSITVKTTNFQTMFCFAWVYIKWNSVNGVTFFRRGIINSNINDDWSLTNGGSTEENFWLNIDVNTSNANITETYLRIS